MRVHLVVREMVQDDGVKFPVILKGYRSARAACSRVLRENARIELFAAAQKVGCVIVNKVVPVEVL